MASAKFQEKQSVMITQLRVLGWLAIVGAIAVWGERVCAQITPDGTLGEERSVVTPDVGKPSDRIDGGARRGANLFHSFRDFNVREGRGAYFINPNGVENIFSRVTGGSRSNILGTLGVLGEADLFLINPNGILFGPNASLDVRGSFTATTANGIGFGEQGFFSVTNPNIPSQLLTVNPLAFFFNQVATQPNNAIENQGFLSVPRGQSLLLVGGKVSPTIDSTGTILVDGGFLQAPGGRVELGGLAAAGTIELGGEDSEWQLNFPQEVARADVALVNGARVDVSAGDGGSIAINARNLNILEGSLLRAGIAFGLGSPQAQAGDIIVQATGKVSIANSSLVASLIEPRAVGKGGNIEITTGSLLIADGSQLFTGIFGQGEAGSIIINASESVSFEGVGSNSVNSGAFSRVEPRGEGDGGTIEITTRSLSVTDGAQLITRTAGQGRGGEIQVSSNFLSLTNGARIDSRSFGLENSGEVAIQVLGTLQADDSQIATSSTQAAGGAISITAEEILLRGDSDIRTEVASGTGGGGDITLTADSILAFDDSDILAFARDGRGGDITLDTPVFFGSRFQPAPEGTDPDTLDSNERVDINASGALSGVISLPDVSFVQNSLTELTESTIDTETLIANSCVVPSGGQRGTFIITGAGGLPVRPGDASVSPYPTGTVRTVPDNESSLPGATRPWQKGDPIIEPTGTYRLDNGKLVMSRECSQR